MSAPTKTGAKNAPQEGAKKPQETAPKGRKTAPEARTVTPEVTARSVVLFGCSEVTKETLTARFPSAESVSNPARRGRFFGMVTLRFKTKEEAEEVAKPGLVEFGGRSYTAVMQSTFGSPEERKRLRNEEVSRKVHIGGLPLDVTAQDLLAAFPGATSAQLLKKQRRAMGASVSFPTPAAAAAAVGVEVAVKGARVTPTAFRKLGEPKPAEKRKLEDLTPTPGATADHGKPSNKKPKKASK